MRYDKIFYKRHQIHIKNDILIFHYLQLWIEHVERLTGKEPRKALTELYARAFEDDVQTFRRAIVAAIKDGKTEIQLPNGEQLSEVAA